MSDPTAHVSVDLNGAVCPVGRLWTSATKGQERAAFQYDPEWLSHPRRFPLEPALRLDAAPHHTALGRALFGALGDSAPDRWGRALVQRSERAQARAAGRAPRTLFEIDYLLAVTDQIRPGALRFRRTPTGPFVRETEPDGIPPLVRLPSLLAASDALQQDDDDKTAAAALRLLFAPGSSLGGARPKASVLDHEGRLHIAKLPARSDEWSVQRWEALALTLARRAGIEVPSFRLESIARRDVLLSKRFDRRAAGDAVRVPFLSAMSALGAGEQDPRSYVDIAGFLRQHGGAATEDLRALWRRLVFTILINNTDDHLRNHGFLLHDASGWRLSPAYDLNPVPLDVRDRYLSTPITDDGDTSAALELAHAVAPQFALAGKAATRIAKEVATAVSAWQRVARELCIGKSEIARMESAFSHPDLGAARA
ncbi:MAG: type II toxin-antitoxin system HipA family toxin [Deltaproteobacteria bacterium]|nr:type II toxin-antitoxin system HipA family toxin [Deltaproteobacteria bacterium]